jgi:hypothetical protein
LTDLPAPGYPARFNLPLENGQWWYFHKIQLTAAYMVCAGDGIHVIRLLDKSWVNEDATVHIVETVGDVLWSALVVPKSPLVDGVQRADAGPRFAVGQVRILPDRRVVFVTPAEDADFVTLRASFDLEVDGHDIQARNASIAYDPKIDQTIVEAERCRNAWVQLLQNVQPGGGP